MTVPSDSILSEENKKELSVEAKLENYDMVMKFIDSGICDCPDDIKYQVQIAVDEIYSNIVQYAYHHETGLVKIRLSVVNDVVLEFEDNGISYNPLNEKKPDISLSAEEREIGGLGVFLVKELMDSVEYKRIRDKNLLILRKKI